MCGGRTYLELYKFHWIIAIEHRSYEAIFIQPLKKLSNEINHIISESIQNFFKYNISFDAYIGGYV